MAATFSTDAPWDKQISRERMAEARMVGHHSRGFTENFDTPSPEVDG
jgi:hypothetical protein